MIPNKHPGVRDKQEQGSERAAHRWSGVQWAPHGRAPVKRRTAGPAPQQQPRRDHSRQSGVQDVSHGRRVERSAGLRRSSTAEAVRIASAGLRMCRSSTAEAVRIASTGLRSSAAAKSTHSGASLGMRWRRQGHIAQPQTMSHGRQHACLPSMLVPAGCFWPA